jgi:lipid-binding SYLF domain-containing protein
MILATDLSIPLRLVITVVARCLDLGWVVAGAEGIGMVMAATGTVMVVGMVVNTTVAPGMAAAVGMPLVDIIVVDMEEVGTTSPVFAEGRKHTNAVS